MLREGLWVWRGIVEASFERSARVVHRRLLRTPTVARGALVLAFGLAAVLLATRLHGLLHDPLLSLYSVLTISVTALVMYLAFARYRDPALGRPNSPWQPRVSCLVAVKNEYEVIDRCIASLLDTGYPNLEVIVVDDASTDGTRERLIELEREHERLRLLLLPESVKKKRALVHGLKYATGEILLFTDSDCVLAPDAVDWRKGAVPAFVYYAHAAFIVATPFMAARYLLYLPLSGDVDLRRRRLPQRPDLGLCVQGEESRLRSLDLPALHEPHEHLPLRDPAAVRRTDDQTPGVGARWRWRGANARSGCRTTSGSPAAYSLGFSRRLGARCLRDR
jgi:hypothetical protein